MNLGERGTLNATDQNRFCLHDSNDDRWSMGLQFVDRNIRRDVSLVEERNDRISKRLKGKKKKTKLDEILERLRLRRLLRFVPFQNGNGRSDRHPPVLRGQKICSMLQKKEICVLNFLFLPYLRQCGRGDGGRDFYAFESRVKFGLFSNQGKKN